MAQRGFFRFSSRWLRYQLWPTWIWWGLRVLFLGGVGFLVAWGLSTLLFWFFPSPRLARARAEAAQRLDSLRLMTYQLNQLSQELQALDTLERRLYHELTQAPGANPDTVLPAERQTPRPISLDTVEAYLMRVQGLLRQVVQHETFLGREELWSPYLPRGLPSGSHEVAVGYGPAYHPVTGALHIHNGIDFLLAPGQPVWATAHGLIQQVMPLPGHDKAYQVIVQHTPSLQTRYYPIEPLVAPGEIVTMGAILGYVARPSVARVPYLHYEVWQGSQVVNPLYYLWGAFSPEEVRQLKKIAETPSHAIH